MAQKDYVGRGRSTGTQRRKNAPRGKKGKTRPGLPKQMIVLAVAVLVTFAGGLWFITHHKKEEVPEVIPHKNAGNGLPPKPEERWKYIKELENRQTTVPVPTEPSAGGEIKSQTQLTDEQRQLLEQMAADMRQQPTQLNEVPWNQQTPAQQQQTLRQQAATLQQQKTYQQQQLLQAERQQRLEKQQRLERQQQAERQQRADRQQQAQQPAVGHAQTSTPAVTAPAAAPVSKQPAATPGKHWLIQCGSFKGSAPAESVRASLAFEGFESRITTGGGWNRVVIGPYQDRAKVDSIVRQLRGSGHTNCITLSAGG
ncbi:MULTISPECIES: cell division protein FtsN [Tatumella]|uniref:Cell division protein FtsN n=1 Tax=Tatumella punctata TaxID=399969 RepID=A0ABW1VQ70_9GAMM|nr:cell division protein FtsN [Tatumella sp. JGM16]MBS0893808.1 cell division protein FtsN [Tatumella sp. JGM130]MBS0913502.1 cell division protein FtsN [Tatumella sp. JGM91]